MVPDDAGRSGPLARLAGFVRRGRVPETQYAPGALPTLRGWSEGAGRRDVVVFTYQGVSSDEVETVAGAIAREFGARVVLASPEPGPLLGVEPARMIETVPLAEAPEPYVLVVPGGLAWRREASRIEAVEWLRAAVDAARGVIAVSTGALLLAAAGLIDDDEAAGHWLAGDLMAEHGVRKSSDRVVQNRLLVTASGALAGAEAATALAQAMRFGLFAPGEPAAGRPTSTWDPFTG